MLCPSLVYRFWRVTYLGDPRSCRPAADHSPTREQEGRIDRTGRAMAPSDRILCFLLGLLAFGRFVLFLNHRWIQEIDLGRYHPSFLCTMTAVGTLTSIWGIRHNILEKEWIDSQRGIASEADVSSQEVGVLCGSIQASCDLVDNSLQLLGYSTTPQLLLQIIACSAQLRARWEKA